MGGGESSTPLRGSPSLWPRPPLRPPKSGGAASPLHGRSLAEPRPAPSPWEPFRPLDLHLGGRGRCVPPLGFPPSREQAGEDRPQARAASPDARACPGCTPSVGFTLRLCWLRPRPLGQLFLAPSVKGFESTSFVPNASCRAGPCAADTMGEGLLLVNPAPTQLPAHGRRAACLPSPTENAGVCLSVSLSVCCRAVLRAHRCREGGP